MEYASRTLPDGRHLSVIPLTFGRARLCLAPSPEAMVYDDAW
jgi:hypothetical protein